jgi:UDP-N-acetylmuramoyl-tripeptide--D-alanyl-D-alanine ligase
VIPLTLDAIAAAVGGRLAPGTDGTLVVSGGVTADSRTVGAGELFVAFPGEHVDGHDFITQALASGAVAALATRDTGGPAVLVDDQLAALGRLARTVLDALPDALVAALTGSAGKTSTKDLTGALVTGLLGGFGAVIAPAGSFNNELGLPLTVLRADAGTAHLVLEMGSRGVGHLRYLCDVAPPRVAAVLNVGSAHLEFFGSPEGIALAKGELVEALPSDGVAVLNADDPRVAAMATRTSAPVLWFGEREPADVRAEDVRLDERARARFTLRTPEGAAPVALRLVGAHQVSNALAAVALTRALGEARGVRLDPAAAAAVLDAAEPVSAWRMQVTDTQDGVTVINDAYNANPASVRGALEVLARYAANRPPGGRAWAVLGGMSELGPGSAREHEEIGRLVARLGIDRLVVVGAEAAGMYTGATGAGFAGARLVDGPSDALEAVRRELRGGDVVLVKASRAIGLEKVALALQEPSSDAPGEADA